MVQFASYFSSYKWPYCFLNWDSLVLHWDSWFFTKWVSGLTITICINISATWAGKMGSSCPLGIFCIVPASKRSLFGHNKTSFIMFQTTSMRKRWLNVWFQKISIPPLPPHGRDWIFQGGGGVNLPNFPVGRGVTIGKYFQRVLVTRKRVTKKKHKNLPRQFICEDIKHDES